MWVFKKEAEVELEKQQVEFVGEYCPVIKDSCIGNGIIGGRCKCYDPGHVSDHSATHPDTPWAVYGPSCCNTMITGQMYVTVEQQ